MSLRLTAIPGDELNGGTESRPSRARQARERVLFQTRAQVLSVAFPLEGREQSDEGELISGAGGGLIVRQVLGVVAGDAQGLWRGGALGGRAELDGYVFGLALRQVESADAADDFER